VNKQPNSYFCFICGVKNVGGVHVNFYEVPAQPPGSPPAGTAAPQGSGRANGDPATEKVAEKAAERAAALAAQVSAQIAAHPIEILARFTGQEIHQGYPGRMHGGIITGILDETIGRAINIGEGEHPTTWGVTAELTVRFRKPVPLGVELTARGRITRDIHHVFEGEGELYLPDGTVAASAHGKYVRLKLDAIAGMDPQELGWRVYED
jgi:acyl-coenzyme A thioesterase PaaI-like protein